MVVAHHGEGGRLAAQGRLQALAVGLGDGGEGRAADQPQGLDGQVQGLGAGRGALSTQAAAARRRR